MRNAFPSVAFVSLALACSSSSTTLNTEDGGTNDTGGTSSVGGARTGTGGRTGTTAGVTSTGGKGTALGGSTSTSSTKTSAAGASNVGGSATGGSGTATLHTGTGATGGSSGTTTGGTRASGGTNASGGAITGGGTSPIGGTSAGGIGTTSGPTTGGAGLIGGASASGGAVTGGSLGAGGVLTGGSHATGGVVTGGSIATGGSVATGGSIATGGSVTTGGSSTGCTGQTKLCNGSCVPLSTCCGGCSGNTPICDNGTCVGRPNGDGCLTSGECSSNVCADGVCCNVACDGQCESCNLPASKGTCSPSTTPRANQPCATDGTVCGGVCDGTAAHRKACVYPTSSTLCGQGASCSNNQARTAQVCNGAGACPAATLTNCSPYTCNGTVCATSCPSGQGVCGGSCVDILSDPAHCGGACTVCPSSTPKCYSGSCVQCNTGSDCVNLGYGSGAVCTSSRSCQCHPPSSGNLLQNPGFDGSTSGWTLRNCPSGACPSPVVEYSTYDYESCPGSGSIRLNYYGFEFGAASQCVRAQASQSYHFGYSYRQMSSDENALVCYIEFYAGETCSGSALNTTELRSGSVPFATWSTAILTFFTPATTGSIQISCQIASLYDGWIDQVYLNGSDGYF